MARLPNGCSDVWRQPPWTSSRARRVAVRGELTRQFSANANRGTGDERTLWPLASRHWVDCVNVSGADTCGDRVALLYGRGVICVPARTQSSHDNFMSAHAGGVVAGWPLGRGWRQKSQSTPGQLHVSVCAYAWRAPRAVLNHSCQGRHRFALPSWAEAAPG
jgi:hypothetical protein